MGEIAELYIEAEINGLDETDWDGMAEDGCEDEDDDNT